MLLSCWSLIFFATLPSSFAIPHRRRDSDEVTQRYAGRGSGGGFSLPISQHKSRKGGQRGKRDEISGSSGLGDYQDLLYTISVTLGSTETDLHLDTGSSDLWTITDACDTSICASATANRYPQLSPSPSAVNLTLNYGDSTTGTYASGTITQNVASLADISMPAQQFAAIDNTTNSIVKYGAAGIFGLGFPSESVILQSVVNNKFNNPSKTDDFVNSMTAYGPLLSRVVTSGELDEPMFAITLQRDTIELGGNGTLNIGKLPDGISNSSLTWVPVRLYSAADGGLAPPSFAPNEIYPYRWEIDIDGVYLDGQQLPASNLNPNGNKVSALIDTGNSILRGPSDVVQKILSNVSPSYSANSNSMPILPCATPHTLSFMIGGQQFPVNPLDFISQETLGDAQNCVADNVVATDPPSKGALYSWSLGDPFLKSNVVAFYYGNLTNPSVDPPRVGLLSTVPSNADSELTQAVQDAEANGGDFALTTQAAPSESEAANAAVTLTQSSVSIPTSTPSQSPPSTPPSHNAPSSGNVLAAACANTASVTSSWVFLLWWFWLC